MLVNFYASPEWAALMSGLTQAQINAKKTAINGHLDHLGCQSWNNAFGFNNKPGNYVPVLVVNQTTGALAPVGAPRNNCLLPAALVYDPVTNPNGTRCGDADLATAVWGTTNGIVPGSLRARQTGDNVGIQYGLNALLAGAITPEEFVTLNEKIGGFDADSNRTAARTTADSAALSIAYRAGIVASGANLGKLPIIDSRGYDEQGIHYIWRSFAERARIDAANGGNHGNQVMWRYGTGLLPATASQVAAVTLNSLLVMDTWLSNLTVSAPKETINSARTQAAVIQAKPATAFDLCYLTGDVTFSTPVTDMAAVRCRPEARATLLASPGRRRAARGEHPEVPAEAAQPGGLRAGRLFVDAVGAAASHFPGWRVRLEPARRWPAGGGFAAHLRRRAGRRAAATRAGFAGEPGALSRDQTAAPKTRSPRASRCHRSLHRTLKQGERRRGHVARRARRRFASLSVPARRGCRRCR